MSGQLPAQAALSSGKIPRYTLDRGVGGPQNFCWRYGEDRITVPAQNSSPDVLVVQPLASRYTEYAITLQYMTLHSMDPKPVKMTIRCEICHINTKKQKTYAQYHLSPQTRDPQNTQQLHTRIFKDT
jgi:hypothetical protein